MVLLQAMWFFKYIRDLAAASEDVRSGELHISRAYRLNDSEDLTMATMLGLALEAKEKFQQRRQQQQVPPGQQTACWLPERVIEASVAQAGGQAVTQQWPVVRFLGAGVQGRAPWLLQTASVMQAGPV